jgi:hypothetical protein
MSGNKIVINQTSGLDQININQDAPKIVQVNQPVTNIVEVRSIGPQGIPGAPGASGSNATSPFRQTGSYWSTGDDIYITGSLRVTNTIIVQGAISASVFSGSFAGNGAGLTNITASTVEFSNITNKPTLISSSLQFNTLTTPFTGSYTGSFSGDGVNLYNIPASGITGLNLSRIASGSVTASIAPDTGLQINTDTTITGGKLAVVGTGSAGVIGNFGIAPLTASFTVWDSQYYASSSQLGFLGPYSTNTVLATLVNKKPFGSATDDEYTQFANYLELSYTASDADHITLNRGIIDINLSSSYTQSGDITANWTDVTQRGNGYNSVGFTNTYIFNTVSQSSYSDNTNGLWTVTSVNSSSIGTMYGVRSQMTMQRSASIDTAYMFQGQTQASTWSRIKNAYGLYLNSVMNTNASMSNYAGVTVTAAATGSIGNALVLLGTGTIPSGSWSIYNTSSFQNYFRGNVGINKPTPTTNLDIIGDVYVTGSIRVTAGASGSFSGSFAGDGSQLTNIPASGIVGLNLNQISSGSVSASISPDSGLQVNTNITATSFTGSLQGTASYSVQNLSSSYAETASYVRNAVSASYAETASYAPAYLPLTGGTISGNLTVIGTASFAYTTASIVQVGGSVITLNTDYPAVRFGGISVIDSGSFGNSSTGSLFWDSLNNRWVYSNPSGSTYDGGMLISGPRNTSGLGNETGMDTNFVAVGQGADHIRPGTIFNSGSITQVTGSLFVTAGVTASFTGSFTGDGAGLYNIPAGAITGLNLNQISSGSVSASISPNSGLQINTNVTAISFTGSFTGSYVGDGAGLINIPASGIVGLNLSQIASGSATASIAPDTGFQINTNTTITGSLTATAGVTASLFGTSSWAENSLTASYYGGSVISSSYAATASYLSGTVISASYATTSSFAVTASYVNIGAITLVNPIVQYYDTTASILAGTTITLPGGLTYVSSSQFEFIEIFINGLRLRYDRDFLPINTGSVQFQLSIPSGTEITYKSLYR